MDSLQDVELPPSVKLQPVIDGKFDSAAPISQRSKAAIERLQPFLPERTTITTSTGHQVTYTVFATPPDPFTLKIGTMGIDFTVSRGASGLPAVVQDFRDTARAIFSFMGDHGVAPSDVFIAWDGDPSFGAGDVQTRAEIWLVVSVSYPRVMKVDDRFVFEQECRNGQ